MFLISSLIIETFHKNNSLMVSYSYEGFFKNDLLNFHKFHIVYFEYVLNFVYKKNVHELGSIV